MLLEILRGRWPDFPQGAQKLGLTDSLWDMMLRCVDKGSARQPSMTEVVELLRELLMSSLSMEADLRDFFEACKTQGQDGQGGKAQEFADELDEVRHTGRHNINSSHHQSRRLTTHNFPRKNGGDI